MWIFRHVAREPPGYLGAFLEAQGCPFEVLTPETGLPAGEDLQAAAGLVLMGGPGNVNEPPTWMQQELQLVRQAAERGIPQLGICLGAQLICKALGGRVSPGPTLEVGWHEVEQLEPAPAPGWFTGLPPRFVVFQWHAHTFSLPPGAVPLLRSRCAANQAFALGDILAMQFHLEMTPEAIRELTRRYAGDLQPVSDCVQDAAAITADLQVRTRRLHAFAGVVYARWLARVRSGRCAG